jgi:hypothetical protein
MGLSGPVRLARSHAAPAEAAFQIAGGQQAEVQRVPCQTTISYLAIAARRRSPHRLYQPRVYCWKRGF